MSLFQVSFKRCSTVHMPTLFVLNNELQVFSFTKVFVTSVLGQTRASILFGLLLPSCQPDVIHTTKPPELSSPFSYTASDQKLEPRKVWEQDCYNLKGGILEVETFNCIRQTRRKCETDSLAWWSECWQEKKNPGL